MWINIFISQFTVCTRVGQHGPLALDPVDMELEKDAGEYSDMQKMVAGDVPEVLGKEHHVEDIVHVQV